MPKRQVARAYNTRMRLAERLIAPVLDGLLVAASLWLMPVLTAPFAAPHWSSALLVTLAYLGLCAGMWLLKLIERPAASPSKPKPAKDGADDDDYTGCLGFLSFSFSVFTLAMLFYAMGIGETGTGAYAWERLPDDHPWLFTLGAILLLVWVCLFPAVALIKPQPLFRAGTPAALCARAVGVLAVNGMVLLSAAWWQATLGGAEPMGISTGGRILLFLCFYVIFLMCYAAPRLALLALDGDKLSVATFLIMLGFLVWPLTT